MKKILSLTLLLAFPFCAQAMNSNNETGFMTEAEHFASKRMAEAAELVKLHQSHAGDLSADTRAAYAKLQTEDTLNRMQATDRTPSPQSRMPFFDIIAAKIPRSIEAAAASTTIEECNKNIAIDAAAAQSAPLSPRTAVLRKICAPGSLYRLGLMLGKEICDLQQVGEQPPLAEVTTKILALKELYDECGLSGTMEADERWQKAQTLLSDETKEHFMMTVINEIKTSVHAEIEKEETFRSKAQLAERRKVLAKELIEIEAEEFRKGLGVDGDSNKHDPLF
jgi:hypothetical protein